jgi:hypothetical protein
VSNATGGLINFGLTDNSGNVLNFCLCTIEMTRRIIWNLYRVEYEHVKNCGKLNAVPSLDYKNIIV